MELKIESRSQATLTFNQSQSQIMRSGQHMQSGLGGDPGQGSPSDCATAGDSKRVAILTVLQQTSTAQIAKSINRFIDISIQTPTSDRADKRPKRIHGPCSEVFEPLAFSCTAPNIRICATRRLKRGSASFTSGGSDAWLQRQVESVARRIIAPREAKKPASTPCAVVRSRSRCQEASPCIDGT